MKKHAFNRSRLFSTSPEYRFDHIYSGIVSFVLLSELVRTVICRENCRENASKAEEEPLPSGIMD
jgi:hypothetical protein